MTSPIETLYNAKKVQGREVTSFTAATGPQPLFHLVERLNEIGATRVVYEPADPSLDPMDLSGIIYFDIEGQPSALFLTTALIAGGWEDDTAYAREDENVLADAWFDETYG